MAEKPHPNQAAWLAEFNNSVTLAASDYAAMHEQDLHMHERALAEARRLREETSGSRRIAKMSNRELEQYVRDCDAERERANPNKVRV
jgi:hypothetical protein